MPISKGDTMARRAYSYIRFSSKKQAEGDSKRRQQSYAPDLCRERGWTLDDSLVLEDLGVPAFRGQNRFVGSLRAFLEGVQSGRIASGSILIIESLDRLTRQAVDLAYDLVRELLKAGITICTMVPEREYSPDKSADILQILEIHFILARAHEESATKSARLSAVWGEKKRLAVADRKPLSSAVPAWLCLGERGFELIPERAEVVKRMFRWCIEGWGPNRIAAALNKGPFAVPSWGRSGLWVVAYVRKILTGRAAIGEYQPRRLAEDGRMKPEGNPVSGYYKAVVTEEEWTAAQRAMKERKGACGRPGERESNLFSGMVYHAETQERLSVETRRANGRQYRYLSPYHWRGEKSAATKGLMISYWEFESAVLRAIGQLTPADVLGAGADEDGRLERIRKLQGEQTALVVKLENIERRAAEPDQDEDMIPVLLGMAREVKTRKKEVDQQLKELKEEALTGRTETLGETQSLVGLLADTEGEEEERLRGRIKARLRSLVDSIWAIVQPINRTLRIVHVQLRLRSGAVRYVQILPEKPTDVAPWNLKGVDFRTWKTAKQADRKTVAVG